MVTRHAEKISDEFLKKKKNLPILSKKLTASGEACGGGISTGGGGTISPEVAELKKELNFICFTELVNNKTEICLTLEIYKITNSNTR
jgi:hypothetical protein